MAEEIVLFGGQLGTQSVRVWLEDRGGGIAHADPGCAGR